MKPAEGRLRVAQALYDAAWALSLPAVFGRFWWRGRAEPAYRQAWRQRLGNWPTLPPTDAGTTRVWVHAVSLGETRAAQPLIQALREQRPGLQLLLTTSTATGFEAGLSLLRPGDLHGWLPLDTPAATQRFFAQTRPQVGVLMETETWPNLLRAAQQAGVPMVLANARLSERSLRKGLKWASLTRPMMGRLSAVCAQTEQDAQHLQLAGVPRERVMVSGNLKYELAPATALLAQGRRWAHKAEQAAPAARGAFHPHPSGQARANGDGDGDANAAVHPPRRPIIMAASWREGEDAPLLQAWTHHVQGHASHRPLLLLVPRHPQRFDEVHAAVRNAGLSVSRRSHWGDEGPTQADWDADAWLGDSVGEMPAYYGAADVALLGGSFAPLGGQNLIEAAACGCPVIMGPHTFNFQEAAERAQQEEAALRAADVAHAVSLALSTREARWQHHRAAGLAWVAANAGAAQRQASAVLSLVGSAP